MPVTQTNISLAVRGEDGATRNFEIEMLEDISPEIGGVIPAITNFETGECALAHPE